MPYIRCEHGSSVANGKPIRPTTEWSIGVGLWLEAGQETLCEAFWQLIALGLGPHNGAQFCVKFKGALAISAAPEMDHDFFNLGIGEL